MDTNVIIAIVAAVIVVAAIVIGVWWFGKASKRSVEHATDEALAKGGAQLVAENADDAENIGDADDEQAKGVEDTETYAPASSSAAEESQEPKAAVETPESAGSRM